MSTRWHRASVTAMNRYVGQTERYIVALERQVRLRLRSPQYNETKDWSDDEVDQYLEGIRTIYGRHDTSASVDAGVWGDPEQSMRD